MILQGLLLLGGTLSATVLWHKKHQLLKQKKKLALFPPYWIADIKNKAEVKKSDANALQNTDIADIEIWIDRHFTLSSVAMVSTLVGLWFPPLTYVSIAALAYLTIPIARRSYWGLVEQRRLKLDVIHLITQPLMIVSGYLPAAALGYWLYYLGLKFMARAKNTSQKELTHIFQKSITTVWIRQDKTEIEINFEDLQVGHIVVVQGGETIPVDGKIVEGFASIDQHAMTGESQPVEKETGDSVFAFTLILSGKIWVKVEKAGNETVAAQIESLLHETTNYAASVELRVEEISDRFVLPTLALGALALPVVGYTSALVVLDSAIIQNLFITGNLNVLSHLSSATQQGLFVKDGRALEALKTVDSIVFDKTGTLTQEQPHVEKVYASEGFSEKDVLIFAATAEYKQQHPVARAILQAVEEHGLTLPTIDDTHYEIGYGVKVTLNDRIIRVGSARFMDLENISVSTDVEQIQDSSSQLGYTLIYVAVEQEFAGVIELHPTIRPEAKNIIKQLKQRNLSLYIISGDHEKPTQALAQDLGIENYFAETLPMDKADIIGRLQEQGKSVCFVGDGINDSIALKKANVSISLNSASKIATDTAQIILMDDSLVQFMKLFELSENMEKNFNKSILWDMVPNAICIGGAFFFHLSIYGALAIYSVGLAGGVINGMLPAIKANKKITPQLSNQSVKS